MLRNQVGTSFDVDEIFKHEWLYVPHFFHTPFYCYAYAFGNLFTLALYEQYKKDGKTFVPKLIKILSLGGSKTPQEIALDVGIDLTSEKFWQEGFNQIEELIQSLENIAKV